MKKTLIALLAGLLMLSMAACGSATLHCDGCGKEVSADPKMDESWIVFCKDCEPEIDFD